MGPAGPQGPPGSMERNWRQCVWQNKDSETDKGLLLVSLESAITLVENLNLQMSDLSPVKSAFLVQIGKTTVEREEEEQPKRDNDDDDDDEIRAIAITNRLAGCTYKLKHIRVLK